jgi:hypothetical protein
MVDCLYVSGELYSGGVKSRQINIRFDPALEDEVKAAAKDRGVTFSEALRVGAKLWLGGAESSSSLDDPVTRAQKAEYLEKSAGGTRPVEVRVEGGSIMPKLLESTLTFRCPRGCDPSFRPSSASAKCGSCGRTVVPG